MLAGVAGRDTASLHRRTHAWTLIALPGVREVLAGRIDRAWDVNWGGAGVTRPRHRKERPKAAGLDVERARCCNEVSRAKVRGGVAFYDHLRRGLIERQRRLGFP